MLQRSAVPPPRLHHAAPHSCRSRNAHRAAPAPCSIRLLPHTTHRSPCRLPADKPFVHTATVFVSHAWRYRAVDVFDAMEAFAAAAEQHDPTAPPTYFWFDLFVNDQHDAISLPQLWWREAFLDGVRAIGDP